MRHQINLDELYHYGIEGQQWGIRRYQNPDGSLTPEGRERFHARYVASEGLQRNKNHIQGLSDTLTSISKDKTQKERAKALRAQLRTERAKYRANAQAERKAFTEKRQYEQQALKDISTYYNMNKRMSNSATRFGNQAQGIWNYNKLGKDDISKRQSKNDNLKSTYENRNTELLNKHIDDVMNKSYVDTIRQRISRLKRRKS